MLDADEVTAVGDAAIELPAWNGVPVWLHGDLHSGNLLVQQGRLSAVIDFGGLGVGDPACDVMAAWLFLSAENRAVFRAVLQVDDATWARGRGWALSFGLIALPYYQTTNPVLAGTARRASNEALADHKDVAFCDSQ